MRKRGILLCEQTNGWELSGTSPSSPCVFVASTSTDASTISQKITEATLAFAKQNSLDRSQVILAVASDSVLFATIPHVSFDAIQTNQALRFELESLLPCNAEEIVADSVESTRDSSTEGIGAVAMEISHLAALVDSLENSQCKIQSIVPKSMLVFQQATVEKLLQPSSVSLWLMPQDSTTSRLEILALDSNRLPIAWQMCNMDRASIDQNLRILNTSSLPTFIVGNAKDLERFSTEIPSDYRVTELSTSDLEKKMATRLLAGGEAPWIDLRRDALSSHDPWRRYRTATNRLTAAMCLFFVVACATLIWRATHYQSLADRYKKQQEDVFRDTFPGQRVPAAILGRLKSEYAKAKGVRSTDTSAATPESALSILERIIQSLTNDFPFEVRDIRIENNRLAMDIELSTQQDAGKVAAALARKGFRVEPPATTLVDGDRIRATLIGASNSEGGTLSSDVENRALR